MAWTGSRLVPVRTAGEGCVAVARFRVHQLYPEGRRDRAVPLGVVGACSPGAHPWGRHLEIGVTGLSSWGDSSSLSLSP